MNIVFAQKVLQFLRLRGAEEAIYWKIYHYQDFAAGALPSPITFFNSAQGAPIAGGVVTSEDTNMDVASQLSSPNRYFVTAFHVPIKQSATNTTPISSALVTATLADTIAQVAGRGYFQFFILSKDYLRVSPLGEIPAGYGLWAALAAAIPAAAVAPATPASANNGAPSKSEGFKVALPLESQTTFRAEISFPKGTVTTANDLRLGVTMDGVYYRPEM